MRPIIRALGGVATALALVIGDDVVGGRPRRQPEAQGAARIDWQPCQELAEVECGTLTPADRLGEPAR